MPSSNPETVIERVRPGQDWLTWKGALRDYHDVQGRIAWNAYRAFRAAPEARPSSVVRAPTSPRYGGVRGACLFSSPSTRSGQMLEMDAVNSPDMRSTR